MSGSDPPGLLDRLRRGEHAAFEDLVRTYQHRIFAVAVRMLDTRVEAEGVAQEVFLRVHRAVGEFRGEARLSTWLYALASRLCLNRLAAADRRRPGDSDDALAAVPSGEPDAAARVERLEQEEALRGAIAALPEERRIVVVLRDLEGLSYEEISEVLDLEPGTVPSRLHRARMDLKDKLERFLP